MNTNNPCSGHPVLVIEKEHAKVMFLNAYTRIQEITGCHTQTELCQHLAIRQSSISDAKKRASIPTGWLITLLRTHSVNPDWILTGLGERYLVATALLPDEASVTTGNSSGQKTVLMSDTTQYTTQWFIELVAKAKAANPEAIRRLVAMVQYLALNAGEKPDGDYICAYHELDLDGKRCPFFKDSQQELGEGASDDEWYAYVFGDGDGDELACSANTAKCWLYAAYKNTK